MTVQIYLWAIIFVCLCGYGLLSVSYPKRKRAARFADREELSMEQIFERFYKDRGVPKDLVLELWNEAAEALSVPGGKLRPTDRFDKELGPVRAFPLVDLNEGLLSIMVRRLRAIDPNAKPSVPENIKSLNDYIEFFGYGALRSKG
jgi:hypothetical protein